MTLDLSELPREDRVAMAMKELYRLADEKTRCLERIEEIEHHEATLLELVAGLKLEPTNDN